MTDFLVEGFNKISQLNEDLTVYSTCCEARVYWRYSTKRYYPRCNNCQAAVPTRASELYPVYIEIDAGDEHMRDWVSFWTGYNTDELEVSISD